MSAANYCTLRDFPLYANDFNQEGFRCPICGTIHETLQESCPVCGGTAEMEEGVFFDAFDADCICRDIQEILDDLNQELVFHKLSLRNGYYYGVQFYAEAEHDLTEYDYSNDECHYYFDLCRSTAYRKYSAEIRKINRKLSKIAKTYGFQELYCIGWFSNGETLYGPASNPRSRLLSAAG